MTRFQPNLCVATKRFGCSRKRFSDGAALPVVPFLHHEEPVQLKRHDSPRVPATGIAIAALQAVQLLLESNR